jgi:hypothetical protein
VFSVILADERALHEAEVGVIEPWPTVGGSAGALDVADSDVALEIGYR